MTPNARMQTPKLIVLTIAILILSGITALAMQEKVSPLSDYQYKRDLPKYEEIKKEADVQKRADLLLAFLKERPISRLLQYLAPDYMACIKPAIDKQDWTKAASMIETLQAALPTPETVKAAIDSGEVPVGGEEFLKERTAIQKMLFSSLVQIYLQSQNWPKAAETIEKVYEIAPDKAMLPQIADIYYQFNKEKYMTYGQKIMAELPMEQAYPTGLKMAQEYIQKQDINSAVEIYSKMMDAFGDKLPPNLQQAQWNEIRAFAYGVMAAPVYAKKDYAKAMELYGKVAEFNPKRDDAHYYIGMCKWQSKDQAGAIESFAKAVALNGQQFGPKAKGHLENLYKAEHSGSTDGLDALIAKAKADLGI